MFQRVSGVCWRQLFQSSSLCIMCCKMCVTVALCLSFLFAFSEGFFMPASLRKQAPQTTYNSQQWLPSQTLNNNNAASTVQANYGNPKEYSPYQQQPQSLHQTQQQHQQSLQPQATYSSQIYTVQTTAPKYDPVPFQSVNQPQYAYEGIYPAPLNSYPQSVQLVPCLCPVNKEVMEQQNLQQQQQQTSILVSPTTTPFSADTNSNPGASPPQINQKKA